MKNRTKVVSIILFFSVFILLVSLGGQKKDWKGTIEKEKLYNFFSEILNEINYPQHKKENTEIMFKRIMGRAIPSKWEYHTMMGVFSKTLDKIKDKKK